MQDKIVELLRATPNLKAKMIASQIKHVKKEVNSFLYSHPDLFRKDKDDRWSLLEQRTISYLFNNGWMTSDSFESVLATSPSAFDAHYTHVSFIFPKECNILLEAAARLLALCNQLDWHQKFVTIDFSDCNSTLSYFDRIGFFEHLRKSISVLPKRPTNSRAHIYRGNNDAVVEFGAIDPINPDENLPKLLKHSFVTLAEKNEYSQPAFTVISELFGNVRDHSQSAIPGFAALQLYKGKRPHIQTVVSDSGKGIIGTLRPILDFKYPEIAAKFPVSASNSDALLLKEIFEYGRISQSTEDGRGLGLKMSREVAAKFNATISVRQENFELKLYYKDGKLEHFIANVDMPKIFGTHICFDFFLDQ